MSSSDAGGEDTLAEEPSDSKPRATRLALPGYVVGETLGLGGMGEVLLARDSTIGRDVAIKCLRAASPATGLVDRFLREAKIQARLDHPAIVPVYELGHDREGRPYFTMKRLAGTTLLERLASSDATLQSLLRAFVDACLASDFAHARGVVHRDLKPANIMLGDYGEVYVLDWGVARILARDEAPAVDSPSLAPGAETQAGALLGTPGYMAPEQARGDEVTAAADVYSLGAILFEILAGEALHPRGLAGVAETLSKPQQAPGARRPDRAIAPELDATCISALAADPASRPTARELADRVQRYLDGDRDLERRRALAAVHVSRAQAVAADPARRAEAIRDAGLALALDPESEPAATLVMTFMLEPPKQLPASLEHQLADSDNASAVRSARQASLTLASSFLLLPFLLWIGITNTPLMVAIYALISVLAIDAHVQGRRGRTNDFFALAVASVTMMLVGEILSPFVILPILICGFVVGLGSQPKLLARPRLVLAVGLATFVTPLALEALGVFESTWRIRGGELVISSGLTRLDPGTAPALLIGAHLFLLTAICLFLRAVASSRREARRSIEIQAWQLRQLLPR